ncbi:MAG: hypothetical protein ABL963_06315 [Longimicrobiales bacterium]
MRTWTPLLASLALTPLPAAAQQPQLLTLQSGFTPDPQTMAIKAGGNIEVAEGSCDYGYIAESGAMGLEFEAGVLDLYFYVESDIDTMLLVQTPSQEMLCDDDGNGNLNPLVHVEEPESGVYVVFVGGYTQNEYRDATLHISELPPEIFGASEGRPNFMLDALFGEVDLPQEFTPDPHTVTLRAGGDIEVDVGDCGFGYVSDAPSVDLTYTTSASSEIHIYVRSDDDTTLLINTPDGEWICDDDSLGDGNPIVSFTAATTGLYDIWVGTFNGEEARATLYISRKAPK